MKVTDVIVMTHMENGEVKLPHAKQWELYNKNLKIHVVVGEDSPKGKRYNWRNSDRILRDWWKQNHANVGECIFLAEWDTFVNTELPELPDELDLAGAKLIKSEFFGIPRRMAHPLWKPENWMWWREFNQMEIKDLKFATGLISFGALFFKKEVIDSIAEPMWDSVYESDIISELRFPTIASALNYRVGEMELPFVSFDLAGIPKQKGIHHAVKTAVQLKKA
jgi:hypothetical protein